MNILNKKKYIEYIIKIKYIIYNYIEIFNAKNEILIINLEILFLNILNIFIYIFYYILSFTQKVNIYIISLSVNNISTMPNIMDLLLSNRIK